LKSKKALNADAQDRLGKRGTTTRRSRVAANVRVVFRNRTAEQEIVNAIRDAKPGIAKYLEIMGSLHSVDISADADFQTKFKGVYRVRQKPGAWYRSYFEFMEQNKGKRPTFAQVLGELRARIGNDAYEPSFSSKLVASIDPWSPVWDDYVLKNTGHKPPAYYSKTKHTDAVAAYASIVDWYRTFMKSPDGLTWVRLFNENVSNYYRITDIKKIDFILWQLRA
jgi:hypothetical protein